MRTDSSGKKYGLEVAAHIPEAQRRAWESAGYVPVAEIFHPCNPIRANEPSEIKATILETREANARLIAKAPEMVEFVRYIAERRIAFTAVEEAQALLREIGVEFNGGGA